jgi:hypothetical protein
MSEGAPITVTKNEEEANRIITEILKSVAELKNLGMNTAAIERELNTLQILAKDGPDIWLEDQEGIKKIVEKKEEGPDIWQDQQERSLKTIEIGVKKFEVGPNLGELNWAVMNKEVADLNQTLKEGEKKWRVLTKDEYAELRKPILEILKENEEFSEEKKEEIHKYLTKIGFAPNSYYWSSTHKGVDSQGVGYAWSWDTAIGLGYAQSIGSKLVVQCVREV